MAGIKMRLREYKDTNEILPDGMEIKILGNESKLNKLYKSCGLGINTGRIKKKAFHDGIFVVVEKNTDDYISTASAFKDKQLSWVGTHPKYRNQGLATAVCRRVINFLLNKGFNMEDIYLKTGSDNSAISMYKKLGFEKECREV